MPIHGIRPTLLSYKAGAADDFSASITARDLPSLSQYNRNDMNFTDDLKEDIKADEDLESGTRTPTKSEKVTTSVISAQPDVQYRMYKRRYAGLFAFVSSNSLRCSLK